MAKTIPHLHTETTRHGRTVHYVRVAGGSRARLRAEFGTDEFWEQYKAALAGTLDDAKAKAPAGSLEWLIARYRESSAWKSLSIATRRQRDNIFARAIDKSGSVRFVEINRKSIEKAKEDRADTPSAAKNFLKSMRGLFKWAVETGVAKVDPTAGVKPPRRSSGPGFRPWTDQDVAAYEVRWPLGTRQRVWLAVLLYTGLRRGDAVRLGRQHVRDGVATIATEKGGYSVEATFRILAPLQHVLDAGPVGDMCFIVGASGKPLTKESFGNEFHDACRKAGLDLSAHGLRKLAATRMAEASANNAELRSVFGWTTDAMPLLYTRAADRKRLGAAASNKLLGTPSEQTTPAPSQGVARTLKKEQ